MACAYNWRPTQPATGRQPLPLLPHALPDSLLDVSTLARRDHGPTYATPDSIPNGTKIRPVTHIHHTNPHPLAQTHGPADGAETCRPPQAREKPPRRMSKVKCCHSLGVCPRPKGWYQDSRVCRWGRGESMTVISSSSIHQPTAVIPSTRRMSSDGM